MGSQDGIAASIDSDGPLPGNLRVLGTWRQDLSLRSLYSKNERKIRLCSCLDSFPYLKKENLMSTR